MENPNIVLFKGTKNGITIVLDETAGFDEIKNALGLKVGDAQNFFGGAKTAITFQGRSLTDDEEAQLLNIVAQKANLNISFVSKKDGHAATPKDPENKKENASQLYMPEHVTKYYGGSLRSGQSIRFSGSVVILGDVNPGAEVIAEGNIIVLGAVKGLVHAGCTGNMECFISANMMMPTQLRIGDIITYIPRETGKKGKPSLKSLRPKHPTGACYAYIQDGQIYISPLVNE